jgi:hypothetical protein
MKKPDYKLATTAPNAALYLRCEVQHQVQAVARMLVEVYDGIPATYSLNPDILGAREIRRLIFCRDEHLGGEGLFISIALSIEIGRHHDSVSVSHHRF